MKKTLIFFVLFVLATGSFAQSLDTTKRITKKKFTLPAKIEIPTAVLNDARYHNLVNNITENYNNLIAKGMYPFGMGDEQIKFGARDIKPTCNELMFSNPFGKGIYPLSYSVMWQNHLLVLFNPGYFMCLQLPSLKRDTKMESSLNTQRSIYDWVIDGELIAKSDGKYCKFENGEWVLYKDFFPLTNSPKLYDDEKYICHADCQGEFGGHIYFYNRETGKTHFTAATCAASVYKQGGKYYVLSSLGHAMGFADLAEIADPEKLPTKKGELIKPQSDVVKKIFNYYGIQLFAAVNLNGQQYYITNWQEITFLATAEGNVITIVDPLLDKEIYMHTVLTSNVGNTNLVTYSFYGDSGEKEAGAVIMNDKTFTRIKWK